MKLKRIAAIFVILSLIFTSGCWDMVEIEMRAMVGVIVVDLIDENEEGKAKKENSPFCEDNPDRIRVTFGVNNPSKLMEGGAGAAIPVTVDAANLPDAMEKLGGRISRLPFYGQTRLLILTDKLLKNKKLFREITDEFERKAVINQQMRVVAFKGDPLVLPEIDPKLENIVSLYIYGIMENSKVLSNTVSMTLNDLISGLRNADGNVAIPLLEIEKGEEKVFTIDKLALINDYKLLTVLDSRYVKTYKLLNGVFKNGRKLINYKGIVVPYYVFTANRNIKAEEDTSGLKFKVRVMLEGDIEQFEFEKQLFDPKVIEDVEKTIDKLVEEELTAATKYFQRDIGYDYLGLGEYLNKYHYRIYKKYEDNWDEAFRSAKVEYEVEAKVRRIGTSKK